VATRLALQYPLTAGLVVLVAALGGCGRQEPAAVERPVFQGLSDHPDHALIPQSMQCGACHGEEFKVWSGSHHSWANRPVMARHDAEAFAGFEVRQGPSLWNFSGGPKPALRWEDPGGETIDRNPDLVIGLTPLIQYLVKTENGRWQAPDMAWDVNAKEWFSIYGEENRRPHEWGHWTQRGMNWNSQCAWCHMTEYRKGYDIASDSYATKWTEQGVGCAQCHGPTRDSAAGLCTVETGREFTPRQWLDTCVTCHSRREELDENFLPGANFHDHYRMALPSQPGLYYADGQQLDEVYNHTSLLLSKMGHAGVTCLDCHDPHAAKPKLGVADNAICMNCHGPGTEVGSKKAQVINELEHMFHAPGTEGGRCVDCHMPTTPYMARDPRHDHSFGIPDPLLTKELGIPNACGRCHEAEGIDWMISYTDEWYGEKMNRPERARTRAVAKAYANDPGALDAMLEVYPAQEIAAWKATLLRLMAPWAADPRVRAHAAAAAGDRDEVLRAAAAHILASPPAQMDLVEKLLRDPVRSVRFEAAWTALDRIPPAAAAFKEVEAVARHQADQPAGAYRMARAAMIKGEAAEAERWFAKAMAWDRSSPAPRRDYAVFLAGIGRTRDAIKPLREALALDRENPELPYLLALAHAETGQPGEAEKNLREAIRRAPDFARAHYNLGLLLSAAGRGEDAIAALREAEKSAPGDPEAPFARATIHARLGQPEAAAAAAREALRRQPDYPPARQLLENLR
jgi:predicted CXXCH cytochrome family protein